MTEYILFMHDDAESDDPNAWDAYLLKQMGVFAGGSEIGDGICMRKGAPGARYHPTFGRIYSARRRHDR
jgi:hypothetical protein